MKNLKNDKLLDDCKLDNCKLNNFTYDEKIFSKKFVEQAWELIKQASRVTLLTHSKPDGDAVAVCAAFELLLVRLGKQVETIYPDSPEFDFKRQPKNVLIGRQQIQPDLLIIGDAANYERIYFPDAFKTIPIINIDHHVSNSIVGTVNFVDSEASSACEVLYIILVLWDALKKSGEGSLIDLDIAKTLLFGILYDSRVFHTQTTSSRTLRIAADLVDRGANLFNLKCELLSHKNPEVLKVWALLLNRIRILKDRGVVLSYIMQEDLKQINATLTSLVGFNDFLSDISNIEITLLFYETQEGKTKVSLRSKTYDVNALAAKFGGGGHKNAAGILSEKPLQKVMQELVAELK